MDKSKAEPTRLLGSGMDPTGTVYEIEGKIQRGISKEFTDFALSLLNNPTIQRLLKRKVIETTISQASLEGYSLVLQHRKISPQNYCFEWPAQMLQDAALITLDICLELNREGLVLKDATPWYVIFDGARPVLVDFTSIMPQETDLLWVAYDQFCRLFLFPLTIANQVSGRTCRALLLDSANGITQDEVVRYLPSLAWLGKPWLLNRLYLPKMMVSLLRRTGQDKNLAQFYKKIDFSVIQRQSFFKSLSNDIASIQLTSGKSLWSRYYADINAFLNPAEYHLKQHTVARIIDQCKPHTVTDIGCNQGGYAILAARAGARVIAFDTDEDSIGPLYQFAKRQEVNILPLVMDVLSPSPGCGWRANQYLSAPERLCSEMAFALGLVHHLVITYNQTFDRAVQTLSDYSNKWLLTEFIPLDDPRSRELLATSRRDMSWYSLDNFLEALRRYYPQIETFPSYPPGRTLCLCQK